MATTGFDLEAWLKDLELSDEERKVIEPVLKNEKRITKLREGQLRQSDYDRKMNKMKEEQATLQASLEEKMKALDEHELALTKWHDEDAIPTLQRLQKEKYEKELELFKKTKAMEQLQSQYGFDPKAYGLDGEPVAPAPGAPQPPKNPADQPQYVSVQDFKSLVDDYRGSPMLMAEIQDISVEHQELFGKPLKGMTKLIEEARQNKQPLRAYWETSQKVNDRRQELAKKQQEEREAAIRAEERTKVLSEHNLPQVRPQQPMSGLSQLPKPSEVTGQAGNRKQNSINEIVAAFNTGKYAEMAKKSRGM